MKRFLLTPLLLLFLCPSADADLRLVGEAKRDSLIRVQADSDGTFTVLQNGGTVDSEAFNRLCVFAGSPGNYVVLHWSSDIPGFLVVTITGTPDPDPNPNPDPDPNPKPPPDPIPRPVQIRATVIEEEKERTLDQRKIYDSVEIAEYLKSRGHDSFGVLNTDAVDEHGNPLKIVQADKADLPILIIQDKETGRIVFSGPLPKTAADTLSLLKKYGGSK